MTDTLPLDLPGAVAEQSGDLRSGDDDFPTPPEGVWPMLDKVPLGGHVWEPACGAGGVARILEKSGRRVTATTLIDRGYGDHGRDFLKERALLAPEIVTNPPFKIINKFVRHAIRLEPTRLVVLAPLYFLTGEGRYTEINSPTPPDRALIFVDRLVFFSGAVARATQPGWNRERFAWFEWGPDAIAGRGAKTFDFIFTGFGTEAAMYRGADGK